MYLFKAARLNVDCSVIELLILQLKTVWYSTVITYLGSDFDLVILRLRICNDKDYCESCHFSVMLEFWVCTILEIFCPPRKHFKFNRCMDQFT